MSLNLVRVGKITYDIAFRGITTSGPAVGAFNTPPGDALYRNAQWSVIIIIIMIIVVVAVLYYYARLKPPAATGYNRLANVHAHPRAVGM